MQSEVIQKNKYQILMWNLENNADEPYMQNRNRDTCREQTYGQQGEKEGCGMNWEVEIDIQTLLIL